MSEDQLIPNASQAFIFTVADLQGVFSKMSEFIVESILSSLKGKAPAATCCDDEYITRKEALEILGISETTIIRWGQKGYLVGHKSGHRVMYKKSEVVARFKGL